MGPLSSERAALTNVGGVLSDIDWVIFDLGGVLVDWNPRYVYRRADLGLGDQTEARIDEFLREVATSDWNSQMDSGTPFQVAIQQRSKQYPAWANWLRMWQSEWPTMLRGPIDAAVDVFKDTVGARKNGRLKAVLALSNWEANTYKIAQARFPFLGLFDGRLISGEEKLIKPDPAFFKLLESRFGVEPGRSIFVDDLLKNTQVAASLGYNVHRFENAEKLRADFEARNIF